MGFRVLHWGPVLALSVISLITYCTLQCLLQWWPPLSSPWAGLNMAMFLFWNVATIFNLFTAMTVGPGVVPVNWKPKKQEDEQYLQYCNLCESFKTPRSHHCRKCDRCVMKMDHHCPWINNCVGHKNHAYFSYFLFWAPIGCTHAICQLIPSLYRALNAHYYIYYGTGDEPLVFLSVYTFIASMFAVGLSVGVIIAVGALLVIQLRSIIKNETGIESWIKDKAEYRDREEEEEEEFIYPYNLGCWGNWNMVFQWTNRQDLDGIWWPVRDGCNQFTLTVEQLKQKREKRDRSLTYEIVHKYSGAKCPVTMGFRVICCVPCTDESRIALQPGDHVIVSRWKKHWLYGNKQIGENDKKENTPKRIRGWFPRKCGAELETERNGEGDKKND